MPTRPSYDCTEDESPDWAEGSWGRPNLSDHPEAEEGDDFDDLSEEEQNAIRGRFIDQAGDDYGSLGYPVLNPATGCLNRSGTLAARQRASAENDSEVASIADSLWEDEFDDEEEGMVTFTVLNGQWIMRMDESREISLNDRLRAIRGQFYTEFDDIENGIEYFVKEVFEDSLIAYADHEDVLYRIGYQWSEESGRIEVAFDSEDEWVVVEQEYVPADEDRAQMEDEKRHFFENGTGDDGKQSDRSEDSTGPYVKKPPEDSLARHCRDEQRAYYRDFAAWDSPSAQLNRSESSEGQRTEVTVNTATEDRHGTIILPEGGRIERYNEENPIVLINHDHSLPAGTSTVGIQNSGTNARMRADMPDGNWDLDDPEVERWFRKVTAETPIVRSASIGAFFHDVVPGREFDAIGQYIDTANRDPRSFPDVVRDWSLVEWSWVSVPSNPDATMSRSVIERIAQEAESRLERVISRAENQMTRTNTEPRVPTDPDSPSNDGESGSGPDQDGPDEKDGTPTRLSKEAAKEIGRTVTDDIIDRATGRK